MGRRKEEVETIDMFATLNADGHEVPDPTPKALPVGFKRPETLAEQVQRLVRTSVSEHAAAHGMETFEEAEDFDTEDEDPFTPYETHFDPILGKDLSPAEFRAAEARYRQRYLDAQREYFARLDRHEVLRRAAPLSSTAASGRGATDAPSPEGSAPAPTAVTTAKSQ